MGIYILCSFSLFITVLVAWILTDLTDINWGRSALSSLLIGGMVFCMGLESFATSSKLLKPYPNGSYIHVEGNELSVKVIEGNHATTQTFSLSDLEVLESRSDSSASLLARNASEIKQGKKPYALYLPAEDYDTVQQIMD